MCENKLARYAGAEHCYPKKRAKIYIVYCIDTALKFVGGTGHRAYHVEADQWLLVGGGARGRRLLDQACIFIA